MRALHRAPPYPAAHQGRTHPCPHTTTNTTNSSSSNTTTRGSTSFTRIGGQAQGKGAGAGSFIFLEKTGGRAAVMWVAVPQAVVVAGHPKPFRMGSLQPQERPLGLQGPPGEQTRVLPVCQRGQGVGTGVGKGQVLPVASPMVHPVTVGDSAAVGLGAVPVPGRREAAGSFWWTCGDMMSGFSTVAYPALCISQASGQRLDSVWHMDTGTVCLRTLAHPTQVNGL